MAVDVRQRADAVPFRIKQPIRIVERLAFADLQPRRTRAARVRAVFPLRDDALEIVLATRKKSTPSREAVSRPCARTIYD